MFGKRKEEPEVKTSKEIISLIGEGCELEGTLKLTEGVSRIDGKLLGVVEGNGALILGEKGYIKGEVKVESVHVYGKVEGNITCNELSIYSTGSVIGDIRTKILSVERGGKFNGKCDMLETQTVKALPSGEEKEGL